MAIMTPEPKNLQKSNAHGGMAIRVRRVTTGKSVMNAELAMMIKRAPTRCWGSQQHGSLPATRRRDSPGRCCQIRGPMRQWRQNTGAHLRLPLWTESETGLGSGSGLQSSLLLWSGSRSRHKEDGGGRLNGKIGKWSRCGPETVKAVCLPIFIPAAVDLGATPLQKKKRAKKVKISRGLL